MLMAYPLTVLGTNRVLDTVISRKPNKRFLLLDLKDTFKIGGLKTLYAGFGPFFIANIIISGSLLMTTSI